MAGDPYKTLGVARSASADDIKKAFRALAKKHHPDQNAGSTSAKTRFSAVNAAYEILGDAQKRRQFDRGEIDAEGRPTHAGMGAGAGMGGARGFGQGFGKGFGQGFGGFRQRGGAGPGAGTRATGGVSPEDLLNELFGGMAGGPAGAHGAGGGAGGRAGGPSPTAEVRMEARIALEDLVAGKARLDLPEGRAVDIALPAGTTENQTIRLRGQGPAGPAGQRADLLVTIRLARHKRFRPVGADLHADLPIGLPDAVLGAKVRFRTLDAAVELALPKGSDGRKPMRLKGKGLPKADGSRGDIIVTPRICLPEQIEPEFERILEHWRRIGRGQTPDD